MKLIVIFLPHRYLTEKQRALITAFAELEEDLQGTVNGVNKKDKGEASSFYFFYNSCPRNSACGS